MSGAGYRYCPSCNAEYQAWATWCHDCDRSLDAAVPPVADDAEADEAEHPPIEALRPVRVAPLDWLRRLGGALAEAGVASWIFAEGAACGADHAHGAGCGTRVALWVDARDLARAREVDAAHERRELPDLAAGGATDDACPACGEPCPPHATACPACGIEFPE